LGLLETFIVSPFGAEREIKIADDSGETGASISVAFWGDKAGEINVAEGQVIAVKGTAPA
jgi:hypothetical protein